MDFKDNLKLGKAGEEKVFTYLNNLPDTVAVVDCSESKLFQRFGVDGWVVFDRENLPFSGMFFDVKTDYQFYRTGKLFVEIMANVNANKKGGILSTKAEVFYYYDPYGGDLYRMPIYALRQWYKRVGISMNHREVENEYGQVTTGVLVSPEDLEAEGVFVQKTNIGYLVSPNHSEVA